MSRYPTTTPPTHTDYPCPHPSGTRTAPPTRTPPCQHASPPFQHPPPFQRLHRPSSTHTALPAAASPFQHTHRPSSTNPTFPACITTLPAPTTALPARTAALPASATTLPTARTTTLPARPFFLIRWEIHDHPHTASSWLAADRLCFRPAGQRACRSHRISRDRDHIIPRWYRGSPHGTAVATLTSTRLGMRSSSWQWRCDGGAMRALLVRSEHLARREHGWRLLRTRTRLCSFSLHRSARSRAVVQRGGEGRICSSLGDSRRCRSLGWLVSRDLHLTPRSNSSGGSLRSCSHGAPWRGRRL